MKKKAAKKPKKKVTSMSKPPGKTKAKRFKVLNEEGEEITMDTITADNKRIITVVPVDIKGRPAPIDGVPVWNVSPQGGVGLFPSPDGLSCEVTWLAPMTQTIVITGDADLSEGIKEIGATVEIQTLPAEAVGFTVTVGPEEPV